MSTKQTQQEYLRATKDALRMDWDSFAFRAGIKPRAMKNYLLPDTSTGFRPLPALARAAVDALIAEQPATPSEEQQAFLRLAKAATELTWDELATATGIHPRALKNYRMPTSSNDHRAMPEIARTAIRRVVAKSKKRPEKI